MKLVHLTLAAAALATAFSANANLIVNGGFEAPIATGGYVISSSIPGWTGAPDIEVQNNVAGTAFEGRQLVELDTNANSGMFQDFATIAGRYYTVHFEYSPRPGIAASSNGIQFLFNNVLLDTLALSGLANRDTVWVGRDFTVLATGSTSRIAFAAVGTSDSFGGYLDNVIVEAAVPEPETFALLALGLAAAAIGRRRRKTD